MRPAQDLVAPDGPAGYALLVRLYARAQARGARDPAADALAAFGTHADAACARRLAQHLGAPWPGPGGPAAALRTASVAPPLAAVLDAALEYTRACQALIGRCAGCGSAACARLRTELPARPVRTLGALHRAWCRAWQTERAARLRDDAFDAAVAALARAALRCMRAGVALLPPDAPGGAASSP